MLQIQIEVKIKVYIFYNYALTILTKITQKKTKIWFTYLISSTGDKPRRPYNFYLMRS